MDFTRRGFLRSAALAGGALVLPTGLVTSCAGGLQGPRRTDHYFVFYYLMGGWDLMLSTDPVKPAEGVWVPYEQSDVVEAGAHQFGPAMAPLLPFMDKTALLRGIYCDALNHPQARFRMVTGHFKPAGQVVAASVQTLIAAQKGTAYELPNLSSDAMRPSVFRGGYDERFDGVRVGDVDQLKQLTHIKGDVAKYGREIQAALAKRDALTAERLKDAPVALQFDRFADLSRAVHASDYGARVAEAAHARFTIPGVSDRWRDQAQLAVEAVKQDLAPCITVGSGEFDSHTGPQYKSHPASVARGLKTVAAIAQGLDDVTLDGGDTLLDRTTIVVTSEFSREPRKNELGGKHHWPANSMLFIGKGLKRKGEGRGPVVFGETDAGLNPVQVNPKNGSYQRGVEDLEMTHGIATLLALAGIDPVPLIGQEPIADLLA